MFDAGPDNQYALDNVRVFLNSVALGWNAQHYMWESWDDGRVWTAWIDYTGSVLEVRFASNGLRPAFPQLSAPIDLSALLGTTEAYVGFTAATGDQLWANHDIVDWEYRPFGTTAIDSIRSAVARSSLRHNDKTVLQAHLRSALRSLTSGRGSPCPSLNSAVRGVARLRLSWQEQPIADAIGNLAIQLACRSSLPVDGSYDIHTGHITADVDETYFEVRGPDFWLGGGNEYGGRWQVLPQCSWDDPCVLGEPLQFTPALRMWATGQIGPWNVPHGSVTFNFTYHEQPILGASARVSMTGVFEGRYTTDGPVVVRAQLRGEGYAWHVPWPREVCDPNDVCTPTDEYRILHAGFRFQE